MSRTKSIEEPHRRHRASHVAGILEPDGWSRLRATIWRQPLDRPAIRDRLLGLTSAIREWMVDARPLAAEWGGLGVDVRQAPMRARGLCSTRAEAPVVYVNERDPYELQRFTVAHEVGHMLLAAGRQRRRPLSPLAEEALCDEFAGRLLIDRGVLAAKLSACPFPLRPDQLLRLCGEFRVNVRPMMIAVGERLAGTPYQLLLARWRGHRRRPMELGFRVEAFAGNRHMYFPRDQRLASLGLDSLAARAEEASHGAILSGSDEAVSIGLRNLPGERTSATVQGPVSWLASRQGRGTPFVLAVMDLKRPLGAP